MKKISAFLCCYFLLAGFSFAQNKLKLIHKYKFEKGYFNSFIEASGDSVYLVCPDLRQLYIVDSQEQSIGTVSFSIGRGPGEISRGPFGLDITQKYIYMGDPDGQRFSRYDKQTGELETVAYQGKLPMDMIYHLPGPELLVSPRSLNLDAYFTYDPNGNLVTTSYPFPEKIGRNNLYRYSGMPTANEKYLIQANRYHGDLIIWDISSGKLLKSSKILSVSAPKSEKKALGNGVGYMPPTDPELEIQDISAMPDPDQVLLLMASKDGKYNYKHLYQYDLNKEQIVHAFKLPVEMYLIEVEGNNLYAYSSSRDRLFHYRIITKNGS